MLGFQAQSLRSRAVIVPASSGTPTPDFSLSNATVTPAWGVGSVIGDLMPNGATPAGAYFILVDEPAGLAVVNG